jgi:predicted ATP-dependent endonuclease of OLD family
MIALDKELDIEYQKAFDSFLGNAKKFLQLKNLKVISDVQSKGLIANSSQVVYGDDEHVLPEYLNGLGFMNILYLLLEMEINKEKFIKARTPLNILFIEEPEAHTHPQMQYVFAKQIKELISAVDNLQALITTHSAHIVSQCDFKDIRYLAKTTDDNIIVKNFYEELKKSYTEEEHFKFLVHFLTLQSSELFFCDKILLIEGATEKILFPYFMSLIDKENINNPNYVPLATQNISIMEVGANSRVFGPFLKFLDIKTLIVTDIDSTKKTSVINDDGKPSITYPACQVSQATHTSNYSLGYFLDAPELDHKDYEDWLDKLKKNLFFDEKKLINVCYQIEESGYHARSFEDSFIHINKEKIYDHVNDLRGLKNVKKLADKNLSTYEITEDVLDKKSEFSSSLLYVALTKDDLTWVVPRYIREALTWLSK